MANGKRNRETAGGRAGLCVHLKDKTCKYPDKCGTARCAKNVCNGFKDPKSKK